MSTPEAAVERYLLRQCRARGLLCLKLVSPGRAGVPDRIVVAPAATVFVEVKRPGGQLRRLQEVTVAKLRDSGGEVYIVDDKAAVDKLLLQIQGGGRASSQDEDHRVGG